ncbi:hypothetical protein GCM10023169_26970 [Georgenia halophila]|uniref:Gram-positive cocci surface proteins LPxTG domain-containing protein n=2 Tax=Georgenia halophila TaxID=620889 RepID=A0ABP8LE65_9MICO
MTLLIAVFGAGAVAAPVAAAPAAPDVSQSTEEPADEQSSPPGGSDESSTAADPTTSEDTESTDPAPEDTTTTEPTPEETPSPGLEESPSTDATTSDETTSAKSTPEDAEGAEAEQPGADAGVIAPLSTSPGTSWIRTENTFYAYVAAGENLDISFAKHADGNNDTDADVTVRGPGGVMETCTALAADGADSGCSWTDLSSGTPGIWQIDFTPVGETSDFYDWTIDVQDGSGTISGRVYSERYGISQRSAETSGVTLWYVSEQGFQYRADYNNYNGINSSFASNATGVAEIDTCVSAYRSMQSDVGQYSDASSLWVPPPGECGDPYKIFFETPSTSLPATAELWDGTTQWLQPPVTRPTLDNLAFTRNSPSTSAGEFTFDVADFTGQLTILIDANDDGDYTDAVDTTVPAAVTQDGTVTVAFDGLDGQGDPISSTEAINARVAITQAGEIHFVNGDVETRDGLQVEALNGPGVGSSTLYWDDTDLETDGRICQTPELDGTAGVDSAGGVHGWPCSPTAGNQNDGESGSWGDTRNIDDWTYQAVDVSDEAAIPGAGLPSPYPQCVGTAFMVINDPSDWYDVDLVTGEPGLLEDDLGGADDIRVNAIGYSMVDDRVYGIDLTATSPVERTGYVVVIGADGAAQRIGPVDGLAGAGFVNTGDVSPDGTLYATAGSGGTTIWAIDVDPNSPDFLTMSTVTRKDTDGDAGGTDIGSDWAFGPDGVLYSIRNDGSLVTVDPATGEVDLVGPIDGLSGGGGAQFFDGEGFMYVYGSGVLYRADLDALEATEFGTGPSVTEADGARCPLAPLPVDFGDAPDGYGTLLADDGPRHAIPGYDVDANTAPLMLGSSIDIEDDGQPNADATGDDANGTAAEDGVGSPIQVTAGQTTTVTVSATNNTGDPATLVGWIDLDGSGTFDDGESVVEPVLANSGTDEYDLVFPAASTGADSYARFRLFPGTVADADASPTGPAAAGEVEDYTVEMLPAPPIFLGCSNLVTFDEDNAGWRAATTVRGDEIQMQPQPVEWGADAGNPGGGLIEDDLDGQWTELWTPELAANGYTTDYSFAIGESLQFDYRNNTGIDVDVYVGIVGANGSYYWYNFRPQIADATQWTRVIVPIDASQWHTQFNNATGPYGPAPTAAAFEAAIANVDRFTFSIEGQTGPDRTAFDNFGQPCDDRGDAPASYGTLLSDDGPSHRAIGYDEDANTAPVMLGSAIDIEDDGQPNADATGDDANNAADEDGVAFNPALGYPNATLRTGVDPTSLQQIENTLEVEASADGFVSVWVDWNIDGDFDDAGEQVASAEAVTAGVNDITFAQGTNPPDIETYVRVRYSTDDTAIADPTGPAPDGEVEDYQVLIERLVQPDVCVDTGNEYYAFTFNPPAPADLEGTGGPGSSVRFRDVAVVEGVPVDLFIETISGTMNANQAPPNGYRSGDGISFGADDAQWQVATDAVLRYAFYEAGTNNPTPVNAVFTVNDMDDHGGGRLESATFSAADLASYAVTQGSAVTITETGGNVEFTGNANSAGAPESRFQVVLEGVDTMDVGWTGFGGSGYGFDGDKDLALDPACEDFGDAPDTYSTTLADDGPRHTIVPGLLLGSEIDFDADGQPGPDADADDSDRLADEDGVADEVVVTVGDETTVTVSATNTTADDATLAGWIDLDGSGTFDAGELVTVAVPAGSGTADYDLTFPAGTTSADTFARFRLFPGTVADADASPVGPAAAGEVEDYPVTAVPLPPFQCGTNAPGILFQREPVTAFAIEMVTGEDEVIAPDFHENNINAIGYNVLDDYVYGWDIRDGYMVRVGSDGNVEPLDVPTGDYTGDGYSIIGDVDDNGHYWFVSDGRLYQVDLDSTSPDFMSVLHAQDYTGGTLVAADWAYVPGTDALYGIGTNANGDRTLVRFDRTTHTFTTEGVLTGDVAAGGAMYADADGFLYVSNNGNGVIRRVDIDNLTMTKFTEGPASGNNDGARCPSPIYTDYGDAPNDYDTELGDDGPRHGIPDYDEAAGTAPLMLGATVDFETDGQPSSAADGDAADEDGVADAIEVEPGLETTVSVSATNNTGEAATLAGWIDLDGSGTFDAGELITATVPAGSGTADYDLTFPVGTTTADTFARFRLFPGTVADADALPTGPAAAGEVEDYPVTVLERELEIEKTSDATEDARPGDVVTYTVTARNTGTADYTTENPAVVLDDLSGVLDDAAYNNDAQASDGPAPSYADPLISWVGELPAGQAVTIEYTVTLATGGDGEVRNVAFGPECDPADADCDTTTPECDPPQDGVDPDTGLPCAETELLLPHLEHTKVADTTELPEDGGVVNYTITVENVGPGVFTATAPGTLTDDLSAVLDDGTYNGDVSVDVGAVTFDQAGESIEWEGALGVTDTATITYSVTYDSSTGDNRLVNVACVPAELAVDPADPCRSVRIPGSELQDRKTVNPASGTSVVAGQDVTYTLYFENTGEADATVDTFDDISDVLDDATLSGGPTTSDPALTAVLNGDQIDITGTVPVGATYTVEYTVTVDAFADQGDHVLGNVLGGEEGCPEVDPTCRTTNPVRHLSVEKTSDAAADVNTGDTVEYTVTVTNDGEGDYTAQTPAVAQDDLTGVLDDATYNGDASASAGTVSYAAPVLTWTGALAAGDSETFTYTVSVTNAGDHIMENVAGPVCSDPEICDPPVTVVTELPHIVPDKSSNPASGEELLAGDVVTYTLSWTNDGEAEGPVDSTDDLSDILDDGDVTSEPVSSDPAVTAVRNGDEIRVTGLLQPGQSVTVVYEVTIKADGERGDNIAGNVLTPDVPPQVCADDAEDCEEFPPPTTEHPIGELEDWKSVDPASGGTVQPGEEVTYTLSFENTGEADVPVDRDDVLTQVLDDATLTTTAASSDPALTVSQLTGERFTITGTLTPGQVVTVTYTVTVNADGDRGDDRLGNFLVPTGQEPPEECEPADDERADCTVNHVSNVVPSKTADPESGTEVDPGQDVTYTLTFDNVSTNPDAAAAPIGYTDHLGDVLDDAELTDGPVSSSSDVDVTTEDEAILITGAVASGETVTVTYTVTVDEYEGQDDHHLGNVLAVTGEDPVCAEDSDLCTSHDLVPPPADPDQPPSLPDTGTDAWIYASAAILLTLTGALILTTRRRNAD